MKIYNTLSGKIEEFKEIEKGKVSMYVCGATVYNHPHIGNARPLIVFDTLRRYFYYLGYEVKYVSNFTDIDDKIINRANEEGVGIRDISERYIDELKKICSKLHIYDYPNINPKATEHIDDIIEFIKELIDKKAAYESDGDVYFDISYAKDYGKLSKKNIDDLISGMRIDINENKKNPLDFALWKKAKEGEPYWDAPFGKGRPGWHIECSAMSRAILGDTLDIHAGGRDISFPHHENEIAQSEALTGKPLAHYWMHNGMVNVEGKKMSKSLGNSVYLKDILKNYDSDTLRFYMLSTHYRKPMNYTKEGMSYAENSVKKLDNAKNRIDDLILTAEEKENFMLADDERRIIEKADDIEKRFKDAMDDDLNTAQSITELIFLQKLINTEINEQTSLETLKYVKEIFNDLTRVFGILQDKKNTSDEDENEIKDEEIEELIKLRNQKRAEKDFKSADELRDKLIDMGIIIKDTKEGSTWTRK